MSDGNTETVIARESCLACGGSGCSLCLRHTRHTHEFGIHCSTNVDNCDPIETSSDSLKKSAELIAQGSRCMQSRFHWDALVCAEAAIKQGGRALHLAYKLHGCALHAIGDCSSAEQSWQESLRLEPRQADVRHQLEALRGNELRSCSIDYVEELFDDYAARFDHQLESSLQYKGPALLRNMLDRFLNVKPIGEYLRIFADAIRVLDLGCGTGLSGLPFRDIAKRLIGVDVSGQMLAKANSRGIYDELRKADILGALAQCDSIGETFHLLVVADVFVYFGDLEDVFKAMYKTLAGPGSLILLSIETLEERAVPYRVEPSGRFKHSLSYVASAAQSAKLEVLLQDQTTSVRKEAGVGVSSGLLLLSPAQHIKSI